MSLLSYCLPLHVLLHLSTSGAPRLPYPALEEKERNFSLSSREGLEEKFPFPSAVLENEEVIGILLFKRE